MIDRWAIYLLVQSLACPCTVHLSYKRITIVSELETQHVRYGLLLEFADQAKQTAV